MNLQMNCVIIEDKKSSLQLIFHTSTEGVIHPQKMNNCVTTHPLFTKMSSQTIVSK